MPRPNFAKEADLETPPKESPNDDKSSQPKVYSDASSSYWPPGWSYERYSHATHADLDALPADELAKMQAGLRDVLGEDGVGELAMHVFREQQRRAGQPEAAATTSVFTPSKEDLGLQAPSWFKYWCKRHEGKTWGFVAFRTACYDDEARWDAFKAQVRKFMQIPLERAAQDGSGPEGLGDAAAKFQIRWVEDVGLAGASAEILRAKYNAMKLGLPPGISQNISLCASPDAVTSVLSPDETSRPTTESKRWRPNAPFLLAVTADTDPGLEEGHEERAWFKPVFKVAVETIIDELWWLVESDLMPLRRITRNVKGSGELGGADGVSDEELDDVWWTMAPSPEKMRKRRRV